MFHSNVISIIAGGSSFKLVHQKKLRGLVVGVNDSFVHARCDVGVSMDRLWTENRWAAILHEEKPTYIRINALMNIPERPEFVRSYTNDNTSVELSESWDHINGNNSAFCALNLAYLSRPMEIWLFGFDMVGPYWYPNYSWKPDRKARVLSWAKQFDRARDQMSWAGIEVFNVSHVTQIPHFRKMHPKEFNAL